MKIFWLMLLLSFPAQALTIDQPLPDPGTEQRAQNLFRELRCVVCQGEAIADSPSLVAADMRREVRRQIAAGKTNDAIKQSLVAQYGERVLMMPNRLFVWLAPVVILLLGGIFLWRRVFKGSGV